MNHITEFGREKLRCGQALIGEARRLVELTGPSQAAEELSRLALADLRSGMDWLEDSPDFDAAHRALDEAGTFVRHTFGCELHREGTSYSVRCPVALAHNRAGVSPGSVILEQECSICGKDPEDCVHIRGREYSGERCYHLITKAKLLEVSVVARPANPGARITSMSVTHAELRERCGPEFIPGVPVNCDRCLSPCDGVVEISSDGPGHTSLVAPRGTRWAHLPVVAI